MDEGLDLPEGCKKWNPDMLPEHFTAIFTSRRRSGKTTMLNKIIYPLRKRFDEIYLFSLTADLMNKKEFSYVPEDNKILGVDEEKLQEILDKQKEILQRNNNIEDKRYHTKNNILIIMDDIIDKKTRSSKVLGRIFSDGRHSHLSLVLLTQNFVGMHGVPKLQRDNSDYIGTFYQHNAEDRKSMSIQYASVINEKEGAAYLKQITNNAYTTAIIDVNNTTARSYQEYIRWYKVDMKPIPEFMIKPKSKTLKKPKKVKKKEKKVSKFNIRTESDIPETPTFGIKLKESNLPIYDI